MGVGRVRVRWCRGAEAALVEEGAGDILPRTRLLDVLGLDAVGRSRQLPFKLAELLVRVGARVRVKAIGLGFGMGLGPGLGLGLGTRVRVGD